MSKRTRNRNISLENIEIINTASKGKAIAKHDGRVIFVKGAVPGDICNINVYKKRKKYWEASIDKIIKESKLRTDPKCSHFLALVGCKWQNMQYDSQLEFKQNEVLNNLHKIGGIELSKYDKILGCEEIYNYRNKMEFTFSNKRWLTKEEIDNKEEIIDKNALGFHIHWNV